MHILVKIPKVEGKDKWGVGEEFSVLFTAKRKGREMRQSGRRGGGEAEKKLIGRERKAGRRG